MAISGNTLVVTALGEKLANVVDANDEVLTAQKVWRKVLMRTSEYRGEDMVVLVTEDASAYMTSDHQVLLVDEEDMEEDKWVDVQDVMPGDYVVGKYGITKVNDVSYDYLEDWMSTLVVEDADSFATSAAMIR